MYGLPISTERKKQLPKKAIYAKFDLKPSQRESFDADIARIDIVAVVSSATVPALSEGAEIKEFYLLAVHNYTCICFAQFHSMPKIKMC